MDDFGLSYCYLDYKYGQDNEEVFIIKKSHYFFNCRGVEYYSKEKSATANSNLNQIAFELEKSKKSDKEVKMNMNYYSGLSTMDEELQEKLELKNGESKSERKT